jgi:hypothetical protein
LYARLLPVYRNTEAVAAVAWSATMP